MATPQGPGRCFIDPADEPTALLALGHGAGGGVNAPDLELLARRLPVLGITVVRFEQPWRTAGRRVAGPPATLDEAWRAAVAELRGQPWAGGRLFVGGRSAGARVACRTALAVDAVGVVCLAFPLHLPGRPEKSRAAELLTAGVPRLVLQGGNDAFGRPAEIREAMGMAPGIRVVELPGADHGFRVAKGAAFTAADLRARVLAEVGLFVGG
ncbi:MAG TPA: alpha/beta family hydrolase [Propionibacteriaceae bacterium]|nr:alpha/beta family hydrolase [Propionibacteriaceae bacterium]